MKTTKKTVALLLSLIMVLLTPVMVFAEDAQFTLTTDSPKLYAGMTYEITAKITNATDALGQSYDGFNWSIASTDGTATLSSKNNYKYDSSKSTITETATFVMPASTNTATITASLGALTQTYTTAAALQPIENYSFSFNNSEHAYYDSGSNTLYLDRKSSSSSEEEFATFSVENITPVPNDDNISFYVYNLEGNKVSIELANNLVKLSLSESIANNAGIFSTATESGRKPLTFNLQPAIPLSSYKLVATPENASKMTLATVDKEEEMMTTGYSTTAGTTVTLGMEAPNPGNSNDKMRYTLYTDFGLTSPAPTKYYNTNGNNCTVNIDIPGTYYMLCENVSVDGGKLTRALSKVKTAITVSQAYPIQKIELYKVNDYGERTDEVLQNVTLYTNTDDKTSTFNLAPCVLTEPDAVTHTDALTYTSSDTKVATVDATGKIKAIGKGTAYIWVRSRDNTAAVTALEVNVKIGIKTINSIATQSGAVKIPAGHVVQMVASTDPKTVDEQIYWSTSNKDVLSINPTTGVATAKAVDSITPVIVYATSESGASNNTPINIIPANRATDLTLSASSTSASFSEEDTTPYKTYTDYYKSSNAPAFIITADAPTENGEPTNDDFVWTIQYNGGAGLSIEEAASAGLISYNSSVSTDVSKTITPLKLGSYVVICRSTVNIQEPQENDPSDAIIISLKQTANAITLTNEATGANADSTIYLPIDKTLKLTCKTSTPNNSKTEDPPTYTIAVDGAEYVNITEEVSQDKEGKTYTIKGLSFGLKPTIITFQSSSSSVKRQVVIYVRNSLSDATVVNYDKEVTFTGGYITFPSIALMLDGSLIDKSQYYTPSYANNLNVGTATITFAGAAGSSGSYGGSTKIITFKINPKDISKAVISEIPTYTLSDTYREAMPVPYVTVDGTYLAKDRDYTISYSKNDRAGTATVTFNGIGNYCGTCKTTFKVVDVATQFNIKAIAAKAYTGKEVKPVPVVYYKGKKLVNNKDFTVTYVSNVDVGTATAYVYGMGDYTGWQATTFTIIPKKAKITKLSKAKKAFTVKWGKQVAISGYQVQYTTNRKFKKGIKTKKVIDPNVNSLKVKKLKKKKKYYVRVRSYRVIGENTYYGAWSPVKSVKTK